MQLRMRAYFLIAIALRVALIAAPALAADDAPDTEESQASVAEKPPRAFSAATFSGIKLREIGPAVASGRVIDIAVVPGRTSTWYVAVASGGVWKTTNAGTT